jgi:ABC-2 type transport system permease protein
LVDYPYFVDIRGDGLNGQSGLTAGLDQVTLTWASPITLDEEKGQGRKVLRLLESSDQAWTSESLDIQPDFATHGRLGFAPGDERGRQLLGAVVEGRFESYFKGKPPPLAVEPESEAGQDQAEAVDQAGGEAANEDESPVITRVIERSPESARLILLASNSFLTDEMLDLAASGLGTRYLKPVELVENAVDWSLEDRGLLAIRGRAQFSRTLDPLDRESQVFWEYLNYGLALLGLIGVWLARRWVTKRARQRDTVLLGTVG